MSAPDAKLLKLLKLENVVSFLKASGWEHKSSREYSSIWALRENIVLIPNQETRDFLPRINEAIQEIAHINDSDGDEILRMMLSSGFEILKVSTVGPGSNNGTVSFEDGVKLFSNIRDLLAASASAVIEPRRFFTGKRPDLASTFLQEARLGQTEHGSFVMTVLAPTMHVQTDNLIGIEESPPYGSRVLTKLLTASMEAKQAAEKSFNEQNWFEETFVPLVEKGVSANLCSAISSLLEIAGTDKIVFSSNTIKRPNNIAYIDIPVSLNQRLAEAASEFRKDPPLNNVYIEGVAISFRRDHAEKLGKVSLKCKVGGEPRRINFNVTSEFYNFFIDAHKNDHIIRFRADLKKKGNSYEASNIKDLDKSYNESIFR